MNCACFHRMIICAYFHSVWTVPVFTEWLSVPIFTVLDLCLFSQNDYLCLSSQCMNCACFHRVIICAYFHSVWTVPVFTEWLSVPIFIVYELCLFSQSASSVSIFHRLLEFRKTPLAVGRTLNVNKEIIPLLSKQVPNKFYQRGQASVFVFFFLSLNRVNRLVH